MFHDSISQNAYLVITISVNSFYISDSNLIWKCDSGFVNAAVTQFIYATVTQIVNARVSLYVYATVT